MNKNKNENDLKNEVYLKKKKMQHWRQYTAQAYMTLVALFGIIFYFVSLYFWERLHFYVFFISGVVFQGGLYFEGHFWFMSSFLLCLSRLVTRLLRDVNQWRPRCRLEPTIQIHNLVLFRQEFQDAWLSLPKKECFTTTLTISRC